MGRHAAIGAALLLLLALGCGAGPRSRGSGTVAPVPRRTVVWLDGSGLDALTAGRLRAVGVDLLVCPRGKVRLGGDVPVLQLSPMPPVAGSIPVAMALRVENVRPDLGPGMASAMWRAIAGEVGDAIPAELILDVPQLAPGVDEFVRALSAQAGVPVVPLLGMSQLGSPEAARLVAAAHSCVVPGFGTGYDDSRGFGEGAGASLADRLRPLSDLGVRVRLAILLHPVTTPPLRAWGEDLNPLTEPQNATVNTSSVLDRTFVLSRVLDWSGRRWPAGDHVAVRWMDAARLNAALVEIERLVLPEVGGWDLVSLPPGGAGLGIGREGLLRYLGGEGPAPQLEVRAHRAGDEVHVSLSNPGPFASAVSGVGNWVELSVAEGSLGADAAGSFDRMVLGDIGSGEWNPRFQGAATAVRFFESYVGPGEELETGAVHLRGRRVTCRVRWHLSLSSGELMDGELESKP